jgi:hypothetical protein
MSLQVAVAAPFRQEGRDRLRENEFVVALSLDRDWMSPDQATRLADIAAGEGLLNRDGEYLVPTFEPSDVSVPDGFVPDEGLFQRRSAFERVLEKVLEDGMEKQAAVAEINQLQSDLGVTIEAAAVVYARGRGLDIETAANRALEELGE